MVDAWTTLTSNSTLYSGDAWEHLHAQDGGGEEITIGAAISATVGYNVGAGAEHSASAAVVHNIKAVLCDSADADIDLLLEAEKQ